MENVKSSSYLSAIKNQLCIDSGYPLAADKAIKGIALGILSSSPYRTFFISVCVSQFATHISNSDCCSGDLLCCQVDDFRPYFRRNDFPF